jgi:hypothetical protein
MPYSGGRHSGVSVCHRRRRSNHPQSAATVFEALKQNLERDQPAQENNKVF